MTKTATENKKLTKYAKKLCPKLFGIKYDSNVRLENTTTSTVARFRSLIKLKDMWGMEKERTHHYHIEIQKKFLKHHPKMLPKVLGHELCHYYCYVSGKPFRDYNDYFQKQLKKHHLPAHMNITDNPKRYVEYCPKCHNTFLFKTRVKSEYSCGKDHTHLKRIGFVRLHGTFHIKNLPTAFKKETIKRLKQHKIEKELKLDKHHVKHQYHIKRNLSKKIKIKQHHNKIKKPEHFKQLSLFKNNPQIY